MPALDELRQRRPASLAGVPVLRRGAASARPSAGAPRLPAVAWVAICAALAAISAAVLPTVPSYDPWSWIVWGREVSDPHLSFVISGGPSWKPLPFLFTTVWGLFGSAAPTLWVITARTGGLLGLVAAWRLASRLAGGRGWGAVAGVLAAAGIVLTQDWPYYFLRGTSEVMLIGLSLWAVDRLIERRHVHAYLLAVAAGLIRPEWWPFIALYGLWLWVREPAWRSWPMRLLILGGLAAQPFFWFVPPWVGSGNPFLAATHAAEYNGHLGQDRLRTVLARGLDDQVLPALIAAGIAVALGWLRERRALLLAMAAGVVAWWVVVVGMTLDGYPGLERFFLPAAALTCVLAGVGVVSLARLAGELAGTLGSGVGVGVAALAAAGLVALSVPFHVHTRVAEARAAVPAARRAVRAIDQLGQAVAVVGGHRGVFPCRSSFAAVNHSLQTALAWKLHSTLERVGTTMHAPGIDFVGPHDATDGGSAPIDPRLTERRLVARVGMWRVYRMTDPRLASSACVGR